MVTMIKERKPLTTFQKEKERKRDRGVQLKHNKNDVT